MCWVMWVLCLNAPPALWLAPWPMRVHFSAAFVMAIPGPSRALCALHTGWMFTFPTHITLSVLSLCSRRAPFLPLPLHPPHCLQECRPLPLNPPSLRQWGQRGRPLAHPPPPSPPPPQWWGWWCSILTQPHNCHQHSTRVRCPTRAGGAAPHDPHRGPHLSAPDAAAKVPGPVTRGRGGGRSRDARDGRDTGLGVSCTAASMPQHEWCSRHIWCSGALGRREQPGRCCGAGGERGGDNSGRAAGRGADVAPLPQPCTAHCPHTRHRDPGRRQWGDYNRWEGSAGGAAVPYGRICGAGSGQQPAAPCG